jgi:LmbE family N-acetylglucosaminyl deacetylase
LTEPYRALVVAAHPDDPEFMCGATVAGLTHGGADVRYVVCTDGCQGSEDPSVPDAEVSATRYAEQRAAAATLGVGDVVFLGFRDGGLAPTVDLRRAITREIRRFRPDLVLTHAPERMLSADIGFSHPDHLAVGAATLGAVHPDACSPRAHPDLLREGLAAHTAGEVWLPGLERADHFVDATGLIDRKIEAILCHRSQVQEPDALGRWIRERARLAGEMAGYEYAERFRRLVTAQPHAAQTTGPSFRAAAPGGRGMMGAWRTSWTRCDA